MTDKSTKSKILRSIVCSIFIGTALLNAQNADKRVPEVRFTTFLYQAKNADFSFPDIKSDFGFVSAFYERICFSFGLLDFVDADTLRKSCAFINRSLKDGKKIQFVVEKYENDADLIFSFGPFADERNTVLVTSNFDVREERLLRRDESMENSWGMLYYIIDGRIINYTASDNAEKNEDTVHYANEMLYDKNPANDKKIGILLEKEIKQNPSAMAYIVLAQSYFNEKKIKKGLRLLEDNKELILHLSRQTDIADIFNCTYEEGRALELIYGSR